MRQKIKIATKDETVQYVDWALLRTYYTYTYILRTKVQTTVCEENECRWDFSRVESSLPN